MVILHTETLKRWGGQQNRVLAECIGLKEKGHKPIIACNRGSVLARRAREQGIKVYELDFNKRTYLRTIPQLVRIIMKEEVDIVSTHSSVDSWAGGLAAKLTGRRLVRFRHNLYPIGRDPLTRFIYAIPDRIVAISEAVKGICEGSGVKKEKIVLIYSAVDTKRFNPAVADLRKELCIPDGTITIGNTSTFTRVKGQQYLTKAFNIIGRSYNVSLIFAGRMTDRSRKKYINLVEPGLRERVHCLNHRDDIPEVLKTLDIFVYPSYMEGLGTALLEAMAMERPVVVSRIPTFEAFIEDGVNGLFFNPKDPKDLASRIGYLINNPLLRGSLGRNARHTIEERFTFSRMIETTLALYEEILKG